MEFACEFLDFHRMSSGWAVMFFNSVGIKSVIGGERGDPCGTRTVVVVAEFGCGNPIYPFVLFSTNVGSKVLFDGAIGSFCLTVGLGVSGCAGFVLCT
jgi:hypothetical protein